MTSTLRQETAQIYAFRSRAALALGTTGGDRREAAHLRPEALPTVSFGSGWYHETAVQDAERTRKS